MLLHLQLNQTKMKQQNLHRLFFLACCIGTLPVSAQTSSGKLSLNKGLKLQVDNSVKLVSTMELMGQSMEITSDAVMLKQVEVKEKKDTSYIISSIITKITTNGNAMGQSFSFDSEKKEDYDTEIGKAMKGQVNVPQEIELNHQGMVTTVKKDTASTDSDNPMMDMMKSMGGGAYDENSGADAFQVLPAGKKNGDTWMDSVITEGIKTYRTYTIKEINGNDATVTLSGTQQTSKKVENQGMEVNVTMEAKLSGEAVVDMSTGIVKQKTFIMEGSGSADAMGQAIPMTTKVTTVTTVKSL